MYKLLEYHMNCNSNYIFGHAEVAGLLATNKLKTYQEYYNKCCSLGIDRYSEDLYNKFMDESRFNKYNIEQINKILAL